ncbi:single-stranded DNA-binding protein [Streptomyces sp. TLI_171]|uniref:single-stranded DNA-binding protein n=1 Tax=Streptomyces sp. TLI_171 TaxID=1938859 RepID=UPI000C1A5037|nr:single-stranded DNA-binding protein [Streptomyces sp. TLI_171]RKE21587.1 single-strand DNA-binding protein [Streptomyces sp. TLI_171]
MGEALVTMAGNAASNVTYRETAGGVAVANFRLAATERRYDRERGEWVDGETTWATVVAWRGLAANVLGSVNKGDPVVVSGRLRVREWGEEGHRRLEVEIDARSVGHDLSRGTAVFRRAVEPKCAPGQGDSEVERPAAAERAGAGGSRPVRLVEEAVPEWIVAAVARHRAGAAGGAAGADGASGVTEAAGQGGSDVAQEVLN